MADLKRATSSASRPSKDASGSYVPSGDVATDTVPSVSVVCDAVNAREMNGAWLREFFSWRKNVSRVYLGRGVVEQFFHYQLRLHTNYIVRT